MCSQKVEFPKVQGGGSLILAWQVKGKHVLVVGGGEVAAGRILNVLNADALVTCICPFWGLHPEVRHRIAQKQIAHIDRVFQPSDLVSLPRPRSRASSRASECDADFAADNAEPVGQSDNGRPDMVLCAIDDPAASTQVWKLCKAHRIPANIADVPSECDFYFGSVHRDGPLQIMVSTNGKGPRLAASIRKFIALLLPRGVGNAIERVGDLRVKLREFAPEPEQGSKRMRWMTSVSDKYSWDDMVHLTEEDMSNLLKFYEVGEVPEMDLLKAMRGGWSLDDLDIFDGSFGFSIGF